MTDIKALITGGGTGIGQAIATKFVSNHIETTIADKTFASFNHKDVHCKSCDVTDGKAVSELFDTLQKSHSLPDILICNAGKGIYEKLTAGDPEKWKEVLDVNIMGVLRIIRAFVPPMLEKKQGDVVIISSVSATKAHPFGGVYSASKAAIEMIAETLRLEVLDYNIRVIVITPGIVDTDFFKTSGSGYESAREIGMGAILPEEVAESVFYAVTRPHGVSLNNITLRPVNQEF